MKKICLALLITLVSFTFFTAFSATLSLDSIGALDTRGQTYSEWWYTGTSPTLTGSAEAGSTVTVSVDEEESTVTADDSGSWSFTSESFSEGDFDIILSSGEESYSFILHLGQSLPTDFDGTSETTSSTKAPTPDGGFGQVLASVIGVSALALGWYFYSDKRNSIAV